MIEDQGSCVLVKKEFSTGTEGHKIGSAIFLDMRKISLVVGAHSLLHVEDSSNAHSLQACGPQPPPAALIIPSPQASAPVLHVLLFDQLDLPHFTSNTNQHFYPY